MGVVSKEEESVPVPGVYWLKVLRFDYLSEVGCQLEAELFPLPFLLGSPLWPLHLNFRWRLVVARKACHLF